MVFWAHADSAEALDSMVGAVIGYISYRLLEICVKN